MTEAILKIQNLHKSFGGVCASDNVSLDIIPGETHAIIGPNGAGKTTLISQITGQIRPDGGSIIFRSRDITNVPTYQRALSGLARSFQITSVLPGLTVLENVSLAIQAHQGHSFRFWKAVREDEQLSRPGLGILEEVSLKSRAGDFASSLSHGERRQLEIAMALATEPQLLLLDEPMAGMGPDEGQQMVDTLARVSRKKTILLVEHDMDVVFTLADRISVLVYGRLIATGQPEAIRLNQNVQRAYLGEIA